MHTRTRAHTHHTYPVGEFHDSIKVVAETALILPRLDVVTPVGVRLEHAGNLLPIVVVPVEPWL